MTYIVQYYRPEIPFYLQDLFMRIGLSKYVLYIVIAVLKKQKS